MEMANVLAGESGLITASELSSKLVTSKVLPSGVSARPVNCVWVPIDAGISGVTNWLEANEKTATWLPAAKYT